MNDILELAARLGKLIRTDPRAERLADARSALENSVEDRELLRGFEQAQIKVHELEAAGKPIEPDDKRNLADLHARVASSEIIKELLKAQVDYAELMGDITHRIEQEAVG